MIKVICVYWDSPNGGHPSGPAHVTKLSQRQPALMGNALLSRTPSAHSLHHPPTQLQLACLTLENRTFQPYKEISPPPSPSPYFYLASSNAPENPLFP